MLKISAIVVFYILISANIFAQRIIPRVGISYATMSLYTLENAESVYPEMGFTGGVGFEIPVSRTLYLQPEINFIQKGVNHKVTYYYWQDVLSWLDKREISLNYIEVPVLLKARMGNKKIKFYLAAGPSVAVALSGSVNWTFDEEPYDDTPAFKKKYNIRFGEGLPLDEEEYDGPKLEHMDHRFDIGIQFAGAVEFMEAILIEVRYGLGLTRLYDYQQYYDGFTFWQASECRTRSAQFTLGVPIRIFKTDN